MIEKQELYCHNCNNYVQFDLNFEEDGNHVVICPSCGHEHCRVVRDGKITNDRWESRNADSVYYHSNATYTSVSTFDSFSNATSNISIYNFGNSNSPATRTDSAANVFLYQSWMNTTTN